MCMTDVKREMSQRSVLQRRIQALTRFGRIVIDVQGCQTTRLWKGNKFEQCRVETFKVATRSER